MSPKRARAAPAQRPVNRRQSRNHPPRARSLSVRTWSLLHVKAVSAALDSPLFGDSVPIKRIVHAYLGFVPSGVKLATGSEDGLSRIVDVATGHGSIWSAVDGARVLLFRT